MSEVKNLTHATAGAECKAAVNAWPDGWSTSTLSAISKVSIGLVTSMTPNYVERGVPLIRNSDIKENKVRQSKLIYLKPSFAEENKSRALNYRDVVTVHTGDIGTSAVVPKELDGCQGFATLNTRVNELIIDPYYLCWFFNTETFTNFVLSVCTGDGRNNLNLKDFAKSKITFPPLPEQQKITAILSSVDEVIEKTQAQIDKLKDLKTGMMQELLTKGIGHTEFKDSPVSSIPVGWTNTKFSVVTEKIQDGTHFSPQSKDGECLYLTSKNIQNGKLDLRKISYISKAEHDEIYKRCDVRFGDVLLTKDGANTGNCAMNTLRQPFSLLSSVALLRCDENICLNQYMYQYILSPTFQKIIQDSMTGNAITRLTLTIIKGLNIAVPPIDEQNKIVSSLVAVDNHIDIKLAKVTMLKNTKKALMQDLLTGKVRVKVI
jgi:type I restriction enzyme S subunit